MSITMRAKMKVSRVERWDGAELTLTVANPALVGMIELGATYYLDFTPAD